MRKRLKNSNVANAGQINSLEINPSILNIDPKYLNSNTDQIVCTKIRFIKKNLIYFFKFPIFKLKFKPHSKNFLFNFSGYGF
jgi:hypothetical protein